jgi:hypothetical protein
MRSGGGAIDPQAISVPAIVHGQMIIIAEHRGDIVALGEMIAFRDETVTRLISYIHSQRMACLWGLVPGSIGDEASPFNECSHAYLAASKALLLHLAGDRDAMAAAASLRDRIEQEMLASGTSLQMCQYSGAPFNTGEILTPHWENLPGHWPSMSALVAFAFAVTLGSWLLLRPKSLYQLSQA